MSVSSSNFRTIVLGIIGVGVVAASLLSLRQTARKRKLRELRQSFSEGADFTEHEVLLSDADISRSHTQVLEMLSPDQQDQERLLEREQLTRNVSFFGEQGQQAIQDAFVIVIGCGGVGSHAAFHLLRSGVSRLRLIDFDQVTLSSLNRHAVAVRSDVGVSKVQAMKSHFQRIFPFAQIEARVELFTADSADLLLSGNPAFVLDCIDNVETKVDLLRICYTRQIPVISSMGSACKADPSRIRLADLADTVEDRLSRAVRAKLRKFDIHTGIPVVFSTERPKVQIMPLPEEAVGVDPKEFAMLENFRVRVLPVLGPLPAIFGAAMAAHVLCKIAGFPLDPLSSQRRPGAYSKLYKELIKKQKQHESDPSVEHLDGHDFLPASEVNPNSVCITEKDVETLYEEVWKGKSALSGRTENVILARWLPNHPARLDNLVLMTKEEYKVHQELKDKKEIAKHYPDVLVAFIQTRLKEAAGESQYWDPIYG